MASGFIIEVEDPADGSITHRGIGLGQPARVVVEASRMTNGSIGVVRIGGADFPIRTERACAVVPNQLPRLPIEIPDRKFLPEGFYRAVDLPFRKIAHRVSLSICGLDTIRIGGDYGHLARTRGW